MKRKARRGTVRKGLAFLLALLMCVSSVDMRVYATEEATQGLVEKATVSSGDVSGNEIVVDGWDGTTTESVYETDGYRVTFSLIGHWEGGYNANIKLENIGQSNIENWCLSFDYENAISSIWNAEIQEQDERHYVIKNVGWNKDVTVGSSVEFGFSGNENFGGFPKSYELLGSRVETKTENYTVDCRIENDWGTGFTGKFVVTNNTEETIEDWVLEFDFNNEITTIWDGEITSYEGTHYVIHNRNYNKDIAAGESVSIGFVVDAGTSANGISNVMLYSFDENNVGAGEETSEREKEPLQSIGEAYYKAPTEEDVVFNEETGIIYVKNQVLVSAYMGLEKSVIEEIADEIDAEIVGYIELTNDYQLEFKEEKSAEELDAVLGYLNSFSFISLASLNVAYEYETEAVTTNDTLYNDGLECGLEQVDIDGDGTKDNVWATTYTTGVDDWNETGADGDNWGLEALNVLSAWEYKDKFQPIKVGIYDDMFSEHEDLVFDDIYNNPTTIDSGHGTHVAGILAAQHNNSEGISGVATNIKLYGYAFAGANYGSSMGDKHAYATLIGNHVKVINVSVGLPEYIQYAASQGNEKAINYVKKSAAILEDYLNKLLIAGYDFLIVTSAGNVENDKFVKDLFAKYEYRSYDLEKDKGETIYSGGVNAYYNCALTAIETPSLKSRIVVVGAVRHYVLRGKARYIYADSSNAGDRVDVCAPGVEILSTVPTCVESSGYRLMQGTSMAAPYITGIAALMYQIDPSMKATTIKRYLCSSGESAVEGAPPNAITIPDAGVCCTRAENHYFTERNDIDFPSGVLTGNIKNIFHVAVPNAKITALKKDSGEYNMEQYCYEIIADSEGEYVGVLPQGTYDLVIQADGYLPFSVKDVKILPDITKYMETFLMWQGSSIAIKNIGLDGKVINAINGAVIEGVEVRLRKGWNNISGSYVKNIWGNEISAVTDAIGNFKLSVSTGVYTAELVKEGYIIGYHNVVAGETGNIDLLEPTTMALVPILPEDEYRIVMTWADSPRDLDSHLTYYVSEKQQFHLFYAQKAATYNGTEVANLDVDDVTGYGPETVTVALKESQVQNGVLSYSVHNFSDGASTTSTALSFSGASVRVYKGNTLVEVYYVPPRKTGTVWHVFDIDKNGISVVNEFYSSSASEVK